MSPRSAQHRQDALAEPVRLLEVRVAGEDELVEAEVVVLGDAVGDLVVAADQRGAGAAADQADAGPHVRVDLERRSSLGSAAVQRGHAPLAHRLGRRRSRRCAAAIAAGSMPASRVGRDRPRLVGGRSGDHVEADAEPQRPAVAGGQAPHPLDPLGHHGRRLAPREVHVDAGGRDLLGRRRTRRRSRSAARGSGPPGSWRPRPGSGRRRSRTARRSRRRRMHLEELAGARVAGVLVARSRRSGPARRARRR